MGEKIISQKIILLDENNEGTGYYITQKENRFNLYGGDLIVSVTEENLDGLIQLENAIRVLKQKVNLPFS